MSDELEGGSADVLSNDFVCAALGGKLDVVRTALDEGQSIEATDFDGSTALCAAAYGGQTEIVSFLLSRGADVNAANAVNGFTPVIAATYTVSVGAVRVLLNAALRGGCAPDLLLKDQAGKSASTYALENIAQGKRASGFVCLQHFLSVDEEPLRESFEPDDIGAAAFDAAHAVWEGNALQPRGDDEAQEDFDRRREAWLHTILDKHPWDEAAMCAAPPSCLQAYLLPLSEFSSHAHAIGEAIAAELKVPLADAIRAGSFVAALRARAQATQAVAVAETRVTDEGGAGARALVASEAARLKGLMARMVTEASRRVSVQRAALEAAEQAAEAARRAAEAAVATAVEAARRAAEAAAVTSATKGRVTKSAAPASPVAASPDKKRTAAA